MRKAASLALTVFCLLTLLLTDARADTITIIVRSASGPNPASIQTSVDQFRADLGNPNNGNNPGPLPSGRREINWDGGGTATTPAGTPFAGFQVTRGALFTTPGMGFVQAPPSGLATSFGNPTYETIFQTFSPLRVFAVVGSNVMDVTFTIPGFPGEPALTSGFGAVFTDVDLANVTSLEFFDINNLSLGIFFGPTADNGLSFLGASFGSPIVSRVRITLGNTTLGPNDGNLVDVVVMDDFIYGEPQAAVPEPATLILLCTGLVGGGAMLRKRYKARSRD
jgi:PEP-CTERM motif